MATKRIAKIEVIKPGSNPDVDSDFNTDARDLVLEHVAELYGKHNVANIITFSSLAAKSAFKTMCTIYEIPFAQANKIANMIPGPVEGKDVTIRDIYDPTSDRYGECAEFREATSGSEWAKVIEGAKNIEGRTKSTGVHPCGVIISAKPLYDTIPLQIRQEDGRVITQWEYPECEALGLIKFDFLGLDTVDLIQHTVEYIMKNGKEPPNMIDLVHGEMDDRKTYQLFSRGDTIGIFQFGSDMVRDFCRLMKPATFEDLAATTATCRPGPMGMLSHVRYANRKNGVEEVDFIHEDFKGSPLEDILRDTYGLIVYQESILKIANQIAGMTLQEGDELRKAMGKKKLKVMLAMKPKFMEGGAANGYSQEALDKLWNTIAEFAKYGFNRCAHGDTIVLDEYGRKLRLRDLHKRWEAGERNFKLLSMWEDGSIKPHGVRRVVYTGKKPVYEVKTASGKSIKITKEHRLLTTSGYGSIEEGTLAVGVELLVDEEERGFACPPAERERRRASLTAYNRSEAGRAKASATMRETQKHITFEERSAHQKKVQELHPERTLPWSRAGMKRLAQLRQDPVWVQKFAETMARREREGLRGYGKVTRISDGRLCDSICEAAAAEYLLARGVDFELHKVIPHPVTGMTRISDFYAEGIYFEMDGLARGEEWFREHKYGDVPFVYLTPYNFVDKIDEALTSAHATNGDAIVAITKVAGKSKKVYDVEMELEGPANFIANGIVSHNSHSIAYAMNAYQAAYLKTHYPVEFMAALVSQNIGKRDGTRPKVLPILKEARQMGLRVGSVDINLSEQKVAPDYSGRSGFDILYGLSGLNAVSEDVANIIIKERDAHGEYASVQNLIDRCSPLGVSNRKVYENLALAGAFDSFGHSRRAVVEALPLMLGDAKKTSKLGASLFDFGEDDNEAMAIDLSAEEYPFVEKLQKEANVIGLYLTDHPLSRVGKSLGHANVTALQKLLQAPRTTTATIIGSITDVERKVVKRTGAKRITVSIDDGTEYLTANLSRDVVKGIDKHNSQERIKKLYMAGEETVADEMLSSATDPLFEAIEDVEKNNVYIMKVTYRPGRGDIAYGAKIDEIRPLELSSDGSLPIRIRVSSKTTDEQATRKKIMTFCQKVAAKYPGDTPIYAAVIQEGRIPNRDDSQYFYDLLTDMATRKHEEAEASRATKKATKKTHLFAEATAPEEEVAEAKEAKVVYELPPVKSYYSPGELSERQIAEKVSYFDTGFTTKKCVQIEELFSRNFGGERVDFGIFNGAMDDE